MMLMFYNKIVVILMLNATLVLGISTIEISPPLTQTTWATNYMGTLFTVTFTPSTTPLAFEWVVTEFFFFPNTLLLQNCPSTTTVGGYTATCTGTETTLSATQFLVIPLTIALTATSTAAAAVNVVLNTEINPTSCQLQQNFATLVSSSAPLCNYDCTATFQCIPGYSTTAGTQYTARCNSFAILESSEACILQSTTTTTPSTSTSLPVWAIVLISFGGIAMLAAFIFILWKYCSRKPNVASPMDVPA